MPLLNIDDDVYQYLLRRAVRIGEDGSSILRRELGLPAPSPNGAEGKEPSPPVGDAKTEKLTTFVSSARFNAPQSATKRYLSILGFLAVEHGDDFEKILKIQGRSRTYFSRTRREIYRTGRSAHPQKIPGTELWAMTNADTAQKRDILAKVMTELGYDAQTVHEAGASLR